MCVSNNNNNNTNRKAEIASFSLGLAIERSAFHVVGMAVGAFCLTVKVMASVVLMVYCPVGIF